MRSKLSFKKWVGFGQYLPMTLFVYYVWKNPKAEQNLNIASPCPNNGEGLLVFFYRKSELEKFKSSLAKMTLTN